MPDIPVRGAPSSVGWLEKEGAPRWNFKAYVTARRFSFSDELNLEQLYKGTFTDCYTKCFLISRPLIQFTCPPMALVLYYVSFAIDNNTGTSGVPEASSDQSHGIGAMPFQQNNSTNHEKQSLFPTNILQDQTSFHSNVHPRYSDSDKFLQHTPKSGSLSTIKC